jgi:hypothetical protein
MDVAYISALSALAGTVIGGVTSGLTSWQVERARARVTQLTQDRSHREDLYKDFIDMASKVTADAAMHNEPSIPDVVALHALLNRIRILSSPHVFNCAEDTVNAATDLYFSPNKSLREVHELIKKHSLDPLRNFSEAARDELRREIAR